MSYDQLGRGTARAVDRKWLLKASGPVPVSKPPAASAALLLRVVPVAGRCAGRRAPTGIHRSSFSTRSRRRRRR